MSHFDDARILVADSEMRFQTLQTLHAKCLEEQSIKDEYRIEVKSLMENLRSALDYCAHGLFKKYGQSTQPKPKVYFPYAKPPTDRVGFRAIVDSKIPGLSDQRPDIVDMLETYQYFGGAGNLLCMFMDITNENKHERLTPQVCRERRVVRISARIQPGQTQVINLKRIRLGGGPGQPYHAVREIWNGIEFEDTTLPVLLCLEGVLKQVRRIVDELSAA